MQSVEHASGRVVLDRPLLGYGLASLGLYGWLALRYPLLGGLEVGRANWATLGDRTLGAGLLHGAVYGMLVLLYAIALHRALRLPQSPNPLIPQSPALIWLVWLAASLILLGAYPGESLDIFDYLFRGRMLAELGVSPLAVSPTAYARLPFYSYITWRGQVDTYGPLWEYASGATAWAVGGLLGRPLVATTGALAAYVTGYRLLAIGASGLCGALVWAIARRRAPALAPAALLAWLWSPLLLIATAVGAHNDIIVALLVLAALWLLQRGRHVGGLLALLLAAHVKLTALLLLPVAGLWLVRRAGWWGALRAGLVAAAAAVPLSWLLYAPLGGWDTLPRMLRERTRFLANAPADLLYRWLQEQAGWAEPDARGLATMGATLLFCLIAAATIATMLDLRAALGVSRRGVRSPGDAVLWRCGLAVTLIYLLVGSFWLMPWYGLWALPLAALLPAGEGMRRWMIALTLGALWGGLGADVLTFLPLAPLTATQVAWATVGIFLAPFAVAALLLTGRPLRRGRAEPVPAGAAE